VLGPNGAGKSTLLRVAATLLRPTPAPARVATPGPEAAHRARGRIGVLGHEPMLYRDLTPSEPGVLRRAARPSGRPGHAAGASTGWGCWARRRPGARLQPRHGAATGPRGAAARSDLQLLDEPHAGLDAPGTALLEAELATRRAGRAVLLVTHEVERGIALADRAIVMRAGRVVLDEPVAGADPAAFRARYERLIA